MKKLLGLHGKTNMSSWNNSQVFIEKQPWISDFIAFPKFPTKSLRWFSWFRHVFEVFLMLQGFTREKNAAKVWAVYEVKSL